jgi:phage terminase large subunit
MTARAFARYIEEERAFGEQSNRFRIRVLGEFPLGDDDTLVPRSSSRRRSTARNLSVSKRDPMYWGVDVARYGTDASTLAKRRGAVDAREGEALARPRPHGALSAGS